MNIKVYKRLLAPAVLSVGLLFGASPSLAHDVKKGDTLSDIANRYDMSLNEVISLNPQIDNPNLIYVGDSINTNKKQVTGVGNTASTDNASSSEVDLLARLVEAEAKGESYAGKVAVASVVLNRVDSDLFPDTIQGVIYQRGQFSPISNGSINRKASSESVKAVEEALSNRTVRGSLYFYNPAIATSSWLNGKQTTAVIGNHVFKK